MNASKLWIDTVMNDEGQEFTLEVEHDWMAGHGLFCDNSGEPNRYRWSVYIETSERPRVRYRYGVGTLERAIEQGTKSLRSFR